MFARSSRCAFHSRAAFPGALPPPQPIIVEDRTDALLVEAQLLQRAHDLAERLVQTVAARARSIVEARLLIESPEPLRVLARRLLVSNERIRRLEQQILLALRAELVRDELARPANAQASS